MRGRLVRVGAASGAFALLVVAAAVGAAPRVSLTATGNGSLGVGQATKLTATAKLPKGAHLVVQAFPESGKPAKIADCLRSPCTATYTSSEEQEVGFEASLVVRKGAKQTTLGRSARIGVFWAEPAPPPPPPPPPPSAVPGHYEGHTQDNEVFAFDVSADGLRITGLHTGQINESCTPPDYYLYGGNLHDWSGPVAKDGTFTFSFSGSGSVGGEPTTEKIVITGTVSNGTASGTIHEETGWTHAGTAYGCTNGTQTWSATKA